MKKIILIGYSGHAFVVAEALSLGGHQLAGYLEQQEKAINPYALPYLGSENESHILDTLNSNHNLYFVGIGHNLIRKRLSEEMDARGFHSILAKHPTAIISPTAQIQEGTLIAAGAILNPQTYIGRGVILNTGSIVEHECSVADFSHVGPGAVLTGNVRIGSCCLIGAGAVIKPGITIGDGATIGAGAVVIRNVAPGAVVAGVPARPLQSL